MITNYIKFLEDVSKVLEYLPSIHKVPNTITGTP